MDTHDESEASPFLVENISLLPKGKALDIAMGNGRNTIYLAEMGFDAEGVDVSEEAVKNALERAKSAGVNINAYVKDIEAGNYIIEKTLMTLLSVLTTCTVR
jgi:tellurite methyltransferase